MVVGPRQCGKSFTSCVANAAKTAFRKGTYGVTLADRGERAEELFEASSGLIRGLSPHMRPAIIGEDTTMKHFRFDHGGGKYGRYRVLSGLSGNVGIGRAVSQLHVSEIPFFDDFADVWSKLHPAFRNRKDATIILESTPAPMSEPSAEYFKEMILDAQVKYNPDGSRNRFNLLFVEFYMSRLNERPWDPKRMKLTNEETRLIEAFGPYAPQHRTVLAAWLEDTQGRYDPMTAPGTPWYGLRNIAFRRDTIANDKEVKRNNALFDVWYPKDPHSCWAVAGGSTFPAKAVQKHSARNPEPWAPDELGVQVYEDPEPNAVYVLGCDPSGYNQGDPAAFGIFKAYGRGEEGFIQVVEFASQDAKPGDVAWLIAHYARKYNDAYVVIEKTGVGLATVVYLERAQGPSGAVFTHPATGQEERLRVRNLHWHTLSTGDRTPGLPANKQINSRVKARGIDMALRDTTVIRSAPLVQQMSSYREDRSIRETETHKVLNPGKSMKGRKPKHHWDRVSAFMLASYGAEWVASRLRPADTVATVASGPVYPEEMKVEGEGRDRPGAMSQKGWAEYRKNSERLDRMVRVRKKTGRKKRRR